MFGNSSEEQGIVNYAIKYSYTQLVADMLIAIKQANYINKAAAHLALCVKFALENGCEEYLVHNCYDIEDKDGMNSDFYLFRAHTRHLTDFLDEKLNWDIDKQNVTYDMVAYCTSEFLILAKEYQFKC